MKNEQAQRRIIAAALFPATSSTTVPSMYEQLLTEQYIEGRLTIYQSVELLEEYHRTNVNNGRRQNN
jgi:Fe2+ or Zn2+ uptake regulation protein